MSSNVPTGLSSAIRQAVLGLIAGLAVLVAAGFVVAGCWSLLAVRLGSAPASFIIAGVFLLVALILLLVRKRRSELARQRAADIDLGLALGRSFYTGFRAGRRDRS